MDAFLKLIGSFIFALVLVAIPVLCGLSYGLNWPVEIKIPFTVITIGYVMIFTSVSFGSAD